MEEEGKKIQEKKVHGKRLITMTIIMLYLIPLILKGVEYLILYLPPASSTPDKLFYILLANRNVRNPTVMESLLTISIKQPVFKIVYRDSIFPTI